MTNTLNLKWQIFQTYQWYKSHQDLKLGNKVHQHRHLFQGRQYGTQQEASENLV